MDVFLCPFVHLSPRWSLTLSLHVVVYVSGKLQSESTELRPQTDRERQLERKLIDIMRRLQRRAERATEELRNLREEHREAVKKQDLRDQECRQEAERTAQTLRRAENAEHRMDELQEQKRNEKALLSSCQAAYEEILYRGLRRKDGVGNDAEMWQRGRRIEALNQASAQAIQRVECAERKGAEVPEHDVLLARERAKQIREELAMVDARKRTLKLEVRASVERKSDSEEKCEASYSRKCQISRLLLSRTKTVEQVRTVLDDADGEIQAEQADVARREKACQEQMDRTAERLRQLQQEQSQVDKRRHRMDELKSTCGSDLGYAIEEFWQTDYDSSVLKQQLRTAIRNEEKFLERLQETQRGEKQTAKALEKMRESLKSARERATDVCRNAERYEEMKIMGEKEDRLHKHFKDECEREKSYMEKLTASISKEQQLQKDLNAVSDNESVFRVPEKKLDYKESGKNV